MKITIEQTLLQAITAHKDGKIQEAESLYASILQVRAMHPDLVAPPSQKLDRDETHLVQCIVCMQMQHATSRLSSYII